MWTTHFAETAVQPISGMARLTSRQDASDVQILNAMDLRCGSYTRIYRPRPNTKLAAKPEEQVSRIEQVRTHQHEEGRAIDRGSKDNCANKECLLGGVLRRAA